MEEQPSASATGPTLGFGETLPDAASEGRPAARPPTHLGRFRIVRELGRGGMGEVYVGFDERLDREVAIKLLHTHTNEITAARLEREAKAMAKLSHPNVISVYEIGDARGQPFIVMELIEGCTLAKWLQTPRPRAQLLETFVAAGRGLAAAHAKGLVHRDFKPANVMIADDGRVLVMDFGLAQGRVESSTPADASATSATLGQLDELDADLTATGIVLGTPAYMAPEQFRGGRADARSDQFAFCVALWEALYGQRPFYASNVAALSAAVCHGRIEAPSRPSARWLHGALLRGLSVEPDARWPALTPLLELLERGRGRRTRMWLLGGAALLALALLYQLLMMVPPRQDPTQRRAWGTPPVGDVASEAPAPKPAAAPPEPQGVRPPAPDALPSPTEDSPAERAPADEAPPDAPLPAASQPEQRCTYVASVLAGTRLQPRETPPQRCRALGRATTVLGVNERALLLRAHGRTLELRPGRARKHEGHCWLARGSLDDDYLSVAVTLDAAACKG